jgi:hypothetical protein
LSDILRTVSLNKPSVLCLSETHVTENTYEREIAIKGYKMVFATSHSTHTGGASIYLREDITFEPLSCVSHSPKWWLCGVNVMTEKGLFRIISLYRSPSYAINEFLEFFDKWLEENEDARYKTIIVGDFNIHLEIKNEISRKTKDVFQLHGYRQHVNFATRVTKSCESLIDLVLSNCSSVKAQRQRKNKIGDHESIKISCDFFKIEDPKPKVIEIRDWKNLDYEALNEKIKDRVEYETNGTVHSNAEALSGEINRAVAELLPQKVIYVKGRVQNQPWYTAEMEDQRNKRDAAREKSFHAAATDTDEVRSQLWDIYKAERNLYTKLIKTGEQNYLYDKIDKEKKDSKKMWKVLEEYVNVEGKTKCNTLNVNFENAGTDKSIEDNFNEFFVESIKTIVQSIPDANEHEKNLISDIDEMGSSFKFHQIDMEELVNIVKNLKSTAVPDNINLKVLLNILESIQTDLLTIINCIIRESCYPDAWKKSMVNPIPKEKNAKDAQNFRPINILPLFEKIVEIVMQKQIVKYLADESILYDMQSGFRENHSCESAIQCILGNWRKMAEDDKITIAVFLDFKRAFETIDRKLLLQKLKKYGFSDCSLKLISSFLSDRKQYVYVNGKKSKEIDVDIGVPQGSVLGPLLFILYINDLPKQLRDILVKIFADDTLLSVSASSYAEAARKMNRALVIVDAWLKLNKVKLNAKKSKFLIIAKSNNKLTTLRPEIICNPIVIEGEALEQVYVFKYLGVMIDSCLKFDEHVSYIIKKVGKKIMYLARLRNKLSMSTKKLVYNCIVAPHFDYCSTVLWKTSEENLDKLQKLQNNAMRSILNCKRRASSRYMLRKIGWLDIRQKIELNILVMVKKIVNKELPSYLTAEIEYVNEVHNYPTRNRNNLYVKPVSSAFGEKSLYKSGFQLYNNLPNHVKSAIKTNEFKSKCSQYLKSVSEVFYVNV